MKTKRLLLQYYEAMLAHFGASYWWPARSPFEVAVGAILTQNTSWKNVEKAIERLDAANALTPAKMRQLSDEELEECLRPSGFYRLKAQRMRAFLQFLWDKSQQNTGEFDDASLRFLQVDETDLLRQELLAIKGVGPETADCILLYGLKRAVFVVDAYTYRIFSRHGLLPEHVEYDEMQELFTNALAEDVQLYNEYHALIVKTGNTYCKKTKPQCSKCPLGCLLEYGIDE